MGVIEGMIALTQNLHTTLNIIANVKVITGMMPTESINSIS